MNYRERIWYIFYTLHKRSNVFGSEYEFRSALFTSNVTSNGHVWNAKRTHFTIDDPKYRAEHQQQQQIKVPQYWFFFGHLNCFLLSFINIWNVVCFVGWCRIEIAVIQVIYLNEFFFLSRVIPMHTKRNIVHDLKNTKKESDRASHRDWEEEKCAKKGLLQE